MSLDLVTFNRLDGQKPAHIVQVADEIAEFLYNYKSKFSDFCEFMRISSPWSIEKGEYKNRLQIWSSRYVRSSRKAAPDTLKVAELANKYFDTCKDDEEKSLLRGLIPELLFVRIFEERHKGKECNKDYGASVNVNGIEIWYQPIETYQDDDAFDSDKSRRTVDAGFWDGERGEFVEIKFNPEAFQTKEINYLKMLVNELDSNELEHQVFLVSLGHRDLTRRKLEKMDFLNDTEKYTLVGRDELFNLKIS